jgi:hypothetical protein
MIVEPNISAIYGFEPMREGEYPTCALVGHGHGQGPERPIVTRIAYREQNLGQYGIGWYDVFAGDVCLFSLQARAVAEIHYAPAGGE